MTPALVLLIISFLIFVLLWYNMWHGGGQCGLVSPNNGSLLEHQLDYITKQNTLYNSQPAGGSEKEHYGPAPRHDPYMGPHHMGWPSVHFAHDGVSRQARTASAMLHDISRDDNS